VRCGFGLRVVFQPTKIVCFAINLLSGIVKVYRHMCDERKQEYTNTIISPVMRNKIARLYGCEKCGMVIEHAKKFHVFLREL